MSTILLILFTLNSIFSYCPPNLISAFSIISPHTNTITDTPLASLSPIFSPFPSLPTNQQHLYSPEEWTQRCQLAICYRIAYLEDWNMNIFNHITLKIKGSENLIDGPHFLINDYGLGFDEVCASNLLKVNLDGQLVGGSPDGRIFKAGYVLHSALHAAREDCHCIWHCHDLSATALCQTNIPVLNLSQEATFAIRKGIKYHPYEGSVNSLDEQERFVQSLGPSDKILMLLNHGPCVLGERVEESYSTMWVLTRALKYQQRSLAAVGGDLSKLNLPSEEIEREMNERAEQFHEAPSSSTREEVQVYDTEALMFNCARRAAERHFGKENIYI